MVKLNIYFLNGPHKGKKFSVQKGVVLTRDNQEKGNILIEDPKASNPHAEIVQKKGKFYLKDRDSKNGTIFEKEVNDFFALTEGAFFQIGKTQFEVKKAPPPQKPWQEMVIETLKKVSIEEPIKNLKPLPTPLVLKFKSGPQKGDKWHIHYGPRTAGTGSLDLPILEAKAPDICFSLEPSKTFTLFKTLYPEKVLLNKKHVSKKKLVPGDCISFASTLIEVSSFTDKVNSSKKSS